MAVVRLDAGIFGGLLGAWSVVAIGYAMAGVAGRKRLTPLLVSATGLCIAAAAAHPGVRQWLA